MPQQWPQVSGTLAMPPWPQRLSDHFLPSCHWVRLSICSHNWRFLGIYIADLT